MEGWKEVAMMDGEAKNINRELKKECSLCGDVGFPEALVLCRRCGYRLQHTYCSRYYPEKLEMERWACEWCIHEEISEAQQQQQQQKVLQHGHEQKNIKKKGSGSHHVAKSVGPKKDGGGGSGSKAVDRWRKLAKATKTGSGKRYKLLTDVLCSS